MTADSPSLSDMRDRREFASVSVTRFEINHLRNFVVLLDHDPDMRIHAGALQKWIEDKTSRPDFRPPTDSVPLRKLIDALVVTAQRMVRKPVGPTGEEYYVRDDDAIDAARQSIESFVTALIEENKRLRESTPNELLATPNLVISQREAAHLDRKVSENYPRNGCRICDEILVKLRAAKLRRSLGTLE